MQTPIGAGANTVAHEPALRTVSLWSTPLIALFAVWLWLAFWSGGSAPIDWLPAAMLLGGFGFVVAAMVAYPRRPRQLSLLNLALLALYALWVAASALWAESAARVWLETERTSLLMLVFALALVYLTDAKARRLFRYLLMTAALVLLVACIWRLWTAEEVGLLFREGRFSFPTGSANGSAALFLIAFWPLIWLAAGPGERAPLRGAALGLATGLLGLAVMTQSRTALYSLGITVVVAFIVSPVRLRTLLYLIVPGLLLVYDFPHLNRYWLLGPEAIGGGQAARTLVVAALAATFMGMILALLERWIPASRRMKAIFGTVVLAGALAGIVYGSIVLTEDTGGPWEWLSRSWRQFTAEEQLIVEEAAASRFTTVSSNGAVGLWRGAWQVFESEPLTGVGAGNFEFAYDRLRSDGASSPGDPLSLPLQTLAETGVVGGLLLGAGVLLSLGGLLWGRCTAGWRRARRLWLRLPGKSLVMGDGSRLCHPRWGQEVRAYGWEMAVLTALAYWLIHASIDRLWQITAVVIPALLLLAAALSAVDARAGTMWPRWERWLRIHGRGEGAGNGDHPAAAVETLAGETLTIAHEGPEGPVESSTFRRRRQTGPEDSGVFGARRSDQYYGKWRRRQRREAREARSAERLQPPGPLSLGFRAALLALAALIVVGAVPPYVSLQLQRSALAMSSVDGLDAAARAGASAWSWPGDPGPYLTQATIYAQAAASQPRGGRPAVLDDLALSLATYERAGAKETAAWSARYQAGVAALNMMIVALGPASPGSPLDDIPYVALVPTIPGLRDWSWLDERAAADPPESVAGSLWPAYGAPEVAHLYRTMTPAQLGDVSMAFLLEARQRSPQAPEVAAAIALLQRLKSATRLQP